MSDRDTINKFLEQFPEYSDRALSVKGDTICTAGGKTLGKKSGDTWAIVPLGGRPKQGRFSHDIRVRITPEQNRKLSDYADSKQITKAAAIRKLIDEA